MPGEVAEVAAVASPPLSDLARLTNVPSNNFLAEMLMKALGGAFGSRGSTSEGVAVVREFAAERGPPSAARTARA